MLLCHTGDTRASLGTTYTSHPLILPGFLVLTSKSLPVGLARVAPRPALADMLR